MLQKGPYFGIVTFVLPKQRFYSGFPEIKYFFGGGIFLTKNAPNQINEYKYDKNQT
ncbi:hypothetical protein SAMN05192574_102811 [Mucilaginibacter gossypiicola]|uniref:Uncharacterized protein n=1 Tax=Mucilaginibacter gossypiicola TaxID=551995 RepID=A0A1H8ER55_9SPHI|nr:hypothetical protein SAMN05192574_102811 [Mucilaginibacter gossypiicola]